MSQSKKAYTLSELLVAVLVLCVLAAVAVPKYSRVLESRKTTEAESFLEAVRTEQEQRCVFGKDYKGDLKDVQIASTSKQSKQYEYRLLRKGIAAQSQSKDYTLRLPSYKDGRMCCEGSYCPSLNKGYPSCEELTASLQVEDECSANVEEGCQDNPDQSKCCTAQEKWDGKKCVQKSFCELNPNDCACNAYRDKHPCECDPDSCHCDNMPDELVESDGCYSFFGGEGSGEVVRTFDVKTCQWSEWDTSGCYCEIEPDYDISETCPLGSVGRPFRPVTDNCDWGPVDYSDCVYTQASCTKAGYTFIASTGECCKSYNNSAQCCSALKPSWSWHEEAGVCCGSANTSQTCCNLLAPEKEWIKGYCCAGKDASSSCCRAYGGVWGSGKCCESKDESSACCSASGGVWNNGTCCADKNESYSCCRAAGGTWYGGTCCMSKNDSAACCQKEGGTWTNGSCKTLTCTWTKSSAIRVTDDNGPYQCYQNASTAGNCSWSYMASYQQSAVRSVLANKYDDLSVYGGSAPSNKTCSESERGQRRVYLNEVSSYNSFCGGSYNAAFNQYGCSNYVHVSAPVWSCGCK